MITDPIKKFIALAKTKNKQNQAQNLFLELMDNTPSMLLLKTYLAHLGQKTNIFADKEKISILGSSNLYPLKDILKALFHAHKINTDYYIGQFGNYSQELMEENSDLYKFKPTITLLVLSIRDIMPMLFDQPFSFDPDKIDDMLADLGRNITLAIEKYFKLLPASNLYIYLIPCVENLLNYIYSQDIKFKGEYHFIKLLEYISEVEKNNQNIFILDYKKFMYKYPLGKIEDRRFWHLGKIRYSDTFFIEMGKEILNLYNMLKIPLKKCLILDLDNTLWGGIIGQDGIENIILGQDGLGKAFQEFQNEILKLYKKGIMLAICSKNNQSDAEKVFKKHSAMILKEEYFISKRINWQNKALNIKEIAKEINIGIDSMVFFDDDPVERKWVKQNLPELTVPDLPQDQFTYADFLKKSSWFNSYRLTHEDTIRNATYSAVSKTKQLKENTKDIWDYLKSLNQTVTLDRVNTSTLSRASQLCQKTNQFNLTTRRYQINDLKSLVKNKNWHLYTLSVKDCFSDYGIVGLLILKECKNNKSVLIDTFLISCRVIGRKIDFIILDLIKSVYKNKKYKFIEGEYIKTEKNIVCSNIYKDNLFECVSNAKNYQKYRFDLNKPFKLSTYNKYIKSIVQNIDYKKKRD